MQVFANDIHNKIIYFIDALKRNQDVLQLFFMENFIISEKYR